MTWDQAAAAHIGHRSVLRDSRTLDCRDCNRKLILPRPADTETPTPPPFTAPTEPPATPEVIADAKRRAAEALAHIRQRRTEA